MKIVTLLLFIFCLVNLGYTCNNDTLCTDCRMIPLGFGPGGLYVTFICYQCTANRHLNEQNQCICDSGFYENGQTCVQCPETCKKCQSQTQCLSCQSGYFRTLKQGICTCIEDYQQSQDSFICKEKPNVLMIVLSSIGSVLCLIASTFLCICLRMRRRGHEVYDNNSNNKRESNNMEIEIYEGYESSYPMDNSSNLFWNSKNYEYKQQEVCSICLDPKPLFVTQCGHYFHANCIYGWLEKKVVCPNCNQEISAKQIRRWCEKCTKVLMPVIRNVVIKRIGKNGKKKKQLVQSTPVESQCCEECETVSENISVKNSYHVK